MEIANELARGSPLGLRAANKLIRLSVSMDMTSTTTRFSKICIKPTDILSIGTKKMLHVLNAIYTGENSHGPSNNQVIKHHDLFSKSMDVRAMNNVETKTIHPKILTHPETGPKSVFLSGIAIHRLQDMSFDESRSILDFLKNHSTHPGKYLPLSLA